MVTQRKKDLVYLLVFVAALAVVNAISSYFFSRIDFTKEKRFTLSDITRSELSSLDHDIQITIYLEGEFPAGFKRLQSEVRDLLDDYKAYSRGHLRFAFVNPSAGSEAANNALYQELVGKGLSPTNLSVKTEDGLTQKIVFPSALVIYEGREMPVNFFQNRMGASPEEVLNNSIQNLEYAFTSAIKKVRSGGRQRIGFSEGHNELTDLQLSDAMNSLQGAFEAGRVNLSTISFEGLDKLKLLIIPKPDKPFSEAEKYKIDYFLMRGGRIFWALDNVNAELDSLRGMGSQLAFAKRLNLDDMLFRYGVRVNYDLVADMNCAQIPLSVGSAGGQPQIQMVPWLFYPIFMPNSAHPLVRNLDGIRSEFASSIDTIPSRGVKKQILLSSSPFSRLLKIPSMLSLQMVEQEPDPRAFRGVPVPVAVLLEGSFPSDFANRPVPEGLVPPAALPQKSKPAKMVVMADGDVLKNQISTQDGSPFPLGFDRYSGQQFGNKNFLLNVVDYLTDDSGIIGLRNKEVKLRLLDRARIRTEKTSWQLINVIVPLVFLAVAGAIQHLYRRRKYGFKK
ncbi:gliding motility-associated ABC transporter substrate-binding protein GldG [Arcticibacter sp. MXS-1]|uniref:gliding motility-associated ABC transporter substrate-binding protein GldG n=1 Tax=Arcticibacter sp. MXS-1 TaxID=3341726 RepID=UPI0035A87169